MIKFLKRPIVIVSLIILAGGIVGGYAYFSRDNVPTYDFIVVEKRELIQEVSVTGRVKPAKSVNLAFEKTGKVSLVYADIGKQVQTGQTLVQLEGAELAAELVRTQANVESARSTLEQYEAALKSQQAKLEEIKSGTRPEELFVAQTKVDNAQKALADGMVNSDNVKRKADVDLANLYNDIPNIIQDAFAKADDAIHKQVDEIFDNDDTNPQLTFLVGNMQRGIDIISQRQLMTQTFKDLQTIVKTLPEDQQARSTALQNTENKLAAIRDFLSKVLDVVNVALGISQNTINTYKANINTARTNINGEIGDVNTQQQAIVAQKTTNENNIAVADAKINDAQNTLASAQAELALKQAGSTPEQISYQEAQIKQAEANIAAQGAQIKQAQAAVQNIQAQISKTIIRAPISGTVTKQDAKVGEIVSANTSIVSLISASQFEIEANVPEADIAKVSVGNTSLVTLDAYGRDVVFEAKVVAVDPAETIVDGVATYKATFQFAKNDERVKSGMTANIDVKSANRENVIAVPQRAIIRKNGDQFVRILNGEDFEEVKVETGLRGSDGNIEIISGVSEGDKVITFSEE